MNYNYIHLLFVQIDSMIKKITVIKQLTHPLDNITEMSFHEDIARSSSIPLAAKSVVEQRYWPLKPIGTLLLNAFLPFFISADTCNTASSSVLTPATQHRHQC